MIRSKLKFTRLFLFVLVALSVFVVAIGQAVAKDSLAPKSAGDRWLPCERWVMYHWNPIDVDRFSEVTGISERQLFRWLQDDDHHTLAGIIKSRGFDPKTVVEQSLAVEPGASDRTKRKLRERAGRLLTQGHLAQHVFFHWFHSPAIREHAREIFGMNSWDYFRARRMGFSPADVGRLSRGYTRAETAARVVRVLARYERRGARGGATSKAQAEHYIAGITKLADVWLDQRYHKKPPKGRLPRSTTPRSVASSPCRSFAGMARAGAASGARLAYCPLTRGSRVR